MLRESRVLPTDVYRNIVGNSSRALPEAWEAAEMDGLADDIRQMPMVKEHISEFLRVYPERLAKELVVAA